MSNGHTGTNCVVVTGFNGILFPLTKPLHYINQFFLENSTVAKKMVPLFGKTAAVLGSNGWGLVINGNYNGWEWKPHWKRMQRPFPFR